MNSRDLCWPDAGVRSEIDLYCLCRCRAHCLGSDKVDAAVAEAKYPIHSNSLKA